MMLLVEQARDTPTTQSLLQLALSNPEWFLFRCAAISTTSFAFIRWVLIDLIGSLDEIRRRKQEANIRRRKVSHHSRKPKGEA